MTATINTNAIARMGDIVRFHRKKAGLSRIEAATIAGIGKTAVYDIENGKSTVRLDTLLKLLDALNLSLVLNGPMLDDYEANADA